MTLHQQIKQEVQQALKEKDVVRLSVLRGLSAGFTNELVAKGKKPSEELADEDAMSVIKRQIKQRKESIDQFEKGDREDLAQKEREELKVLEPYLPKMAGEDEIKAVVEKKITELGIDKNDQSKKGILIGAVIKEFAGNADGGDVSKVVNEVLR